MRLDKIKEYIGDKDFYKTVLAIALPISLQYMITVGVNMVDTMMLGTMGEVALSASSLANQYISVYNICCMGIGMGASVIVSRFWGSKDIQSLKKAITIMLRLIVAVGILFMLPTIIMPGGVMRIYTSEVEIIAGGVDYFRWSVPSFLLMGISLCCSIVLRSVGSAKVPLVCSIISFVSNIFFNWVFIFGKLGAPRMEIAGAALGTVIARLFEFTAIMFFFFKLDQKIKFRLKDLFMKCGDLVGEYLRICIPVLVSDALMAFGNNAIAMIMGRIGAQFVSANSITMVTQQLCNVLAQGIAQAGCIVTGHTLGRGERDRAQKEAWNFLVFGTIVGIFAGILIMILSRPIISCYNITEETAGIALQLMNAVAFIVVFQASNSIICKGVLRGGGDTKFLMVADILFLWIASIPLGILSGLVWGLSPFVIYTCMKIDQIIKFGWAIIRLRSGKWIKKISNA